MVNQMLGRAVCLLSALTQTCSHFIHAYWLREPITSKECVAATHWSSVLTKYSIVQLLSTCGVQNDTKDSHWLVDEPMICLKTSFSFSPQFDSTVHIFLA
jgi:hypothetical protein